MATQEQLIEAFGQLNDACIKFSDSLVIQFRPIYDAIVDFESAIARDFIAATPARTKAVLMIHALGKKRRGHNLLHGKERKRVKLLRSQWRRGLI